MFLFSLLRKKRRRVKKIRSPKIFIPTPGKWLVIPFRPLGLILIIILSTAVVYLSFRSDLFLVRDFVFESEESTVYLTEEELESSLQSYLARSIFFLDPQEIENDLQSQFFSLKEVKISKKFPDKLIISWKSRVPVALVEQDNLRFVVDDQGILFSSAQGEEKLPLIWGEGLTNFNLGNQLTLTNFDRLLEIIFFCKNEQEFSLQKIILLAQGEAVLQTELGWQAIFSLDSEVNSQLLLLRAIVNQFNREGSAFSEIDLRYSHPVIR